MYDYSDSKRVGRGIWFSWLVMSATADTIDKRMYACDHFKKCNKYFKSTLMRQSTNDFINKNPPEYHIRTSNELFDWVVEFMNDINIKIGKPKYDLSKIYKIFHDDSVGICSADCGEHQKNEGIIDMYDYSDPKRMRGVWFSFLVLSAQAKEKDEKLFGCYHIRQCQKNFKCLKCKAHFEIKLKDNPPEKHISTPNSLFNWVVDFMSDVNETNNRPRYNLKEIHRIFHEEDYTLVIESDQINKFKNNTIGTPIRRPNPFS